MNSNFLGKLLELQNFAVVYLIIIYYLSPLVWYSTNLNLPSFSVNQEYVNPGSIILGFLAITFFLFGTRFREKKYLNSYIVNNPRIYNIGVEKN